MNKIVDFFFTACDTTLSSNPSLTGVNGDDEFYIVFKEDFIVGILSSNLDHENNGEDFHFGTFNEAKEFMMSKFDVRISDKSKREVINFLDLFRRITLK